MVKRKQFNLRPLYARLTPNWEYFMRNDVIVYLYEVLSREVIKVNEGLWDIL